MSTPKELVFGGAEPLLGTLAVPGDKSMSHRALIFAALATGTSSIAHLAGGADVACTRAVLVALGVRIRVRADEGVVVAGAGFEGLREPEVVLDCGNSGTTMRLVAGLLAGRPLHAVLTGDDSLLRRPMMRVVEPLRAMGAKITGRNGGALAPLAIQGAALTGCRHELPVASAQVSSALVLAGLQADGETFIAEPGMSRDHTVRMLAALGAPVVRVDERTLRVHAGAPMPFEFVVPGDPSSAAFFVVAACITPGSSIRLRGVSLNPTRIGFVTVLQRMGARITIEPTGDVLGEPVGDLVVEASTLEGTVISGAEIPNVIDEIPVLAVAAAFAHGRTEIRDAAELRHKESDRIGTIAQELTQMGVGVTTLPDGLDIEGGQPRAGLFKSHGDHRIAMAGAVAAHALAGASTVRGWRAVSSSYPEFLTDFSTLLRSTGTMGTPGP